MICRLSTEQSVDIFKRYTSYDKALAAVEYLKALESALNEDIEVDPIDFLDCHEIRSTSEISDDDINRILYEASNGYIVLAKE